MFYGFFALRFSDYFVLLSFFAAIVRVLKQQQKEHNAHAHAINYLFEINFALEKERVFIFTI